MGAGKIGCGDDFVSLAVAKMIALRSLMPSGRWKTLGKAVFSLTVLALIFYNIRIEEVARTWGSFPVSWLLVIVPIFMLDRLVMSWKWTFLLRPLSSCPSQLTAFRIYYTSSFLGYLIPLGIGPDVVRFFKMKKEGYQGGKIIVSIVVERLLGIIANILILVFSIVLLLWLAFRIDFVRDVAFVTAMVAALSFLVVFLLFSEKSWTFISRLKFAGGWKEKAGYVAFEAGLAQLRNNKVALVLFTAISFVEQFFPIAVVYFVAKAVNLPLSLAACIAFVPLSIFLQRLPLSFMGLGVREGSYVLFLHFLGIDAGKAVGLGLLVFAIEILALLPAAVWLLVEQFSPGKDAAWQETAEAAEPLPVEGRESARNLSE
jgi:glycosyltransferase 2 family protein